MFRTLHKKGQRFPQKCNQTVQDLKGPLYLDVQEILPWYHMHHQGVKQLYICLQSTTLQLQVLHYKIECVDNMDHLTMIFSCRRKNNRWPMVLFYNMLDVAGVAAFVIWISLNPDWSFCDRQGRHRKFLKQLGQELTNDYIQIPLQS